MVQGEESSWRMAASTHHERAIPLNQALAYGVQAHASPSVAAAPPASFLDFQPAAAAAAYFGELEEALIHGANAGGVVDPGMIRADVHSKSAAAAATAGYLAARPPTLEIFPSWPMRQQQQLHSGNSQSVGSTTDSSSAQNTMPQMELVSPASIRASSEHQHQQQQPGQEVMMVTTDDYSYKPGLAAASPSFQQQHQLQHHQQQQLHGGGDHDKTERRLAQNREAARKSRLRKKGLCAKPRDQQGQASADRARTPKSTVTGPVSWGVQSSRRHEFCKIVCRRGHVRHGVRALAGRRQQAADRPPWRPAGAPAGHQPWPHRGGVHAALRRAVPAQGGARALRRLPPPHRHVGYPRRALLPLDGRLPPLRPSQDTDTAAGPADGAADAGDLQPAAVVGAGGGGARAGAAAAAPVARRHRRRRHAQRRPRRAQLHEPHGHRPGQARQPRKLLPAGTSTA
nr:transcription factor LG2 isoform X5 [Oryza sativa Japonica Group]